MSKCKKMVSMGLAVMLLLTNAVFATVSAEEEAKDPMASGVTLTETDAKNAEKLLALGVIVPVEEQKLGNYLTRGEMVDVLTHYLRFDTASSEKGTTPFLDVSAFDDQIGAYSLLYKSGYIMGDENKMFRPNDLLTYNEAVTFVVNAMGYKMFAIRNGGYPEGYLYTANKYGMLKDLRGNGTDPIPYCDLYRIIESSLEADAVVERYFYGNGEGDVTLQKDFSVLEELYGIAYRRGVVTGNENTRLLSSGSELIDRYQIEIENVVYDTPDQEYAELLGKNVVAYVREVQGEQAIVYMEEEQGKNTTYTIYAEDLLKNKTTSDTIYYADEAGKEKKLHIEPVNRTVIYNEKSYNGFGALKNVLPDSGYIVGLDNTGDWVIDVLFVYEYQNFVVGAVDRENGVIYDKYTNEPLSVDAELDEVRIYDEEGNQKGLGSITQGSVISVLKTMPNNKDYSILHVYIQNASVEGVIDEVSGDKYLIDGTYYTIAQNLAGYIENDILGALQSGVGGEFYLDRAGRIANYERSENIGMTYAFVAGIDTGEGISTNLILKIFTQNSDWLEMETANKVNIDGERYNVGTEQGKNLAASQIPVGEVILYSENNGVITYIDTAARNKGNLSAASDAGNLNQVASGDAFFTRYGMCHEYGDTSKNKFMVNSKCIIFETPSRGELLEKTDEYAVVNSLVQYYYMPQNPGGWWQRLSDKYFVYNTFEKDINVATCLLLRGTNSGRSTVKKEAGEKKVVIGNIGSVALSTRSQMGVVSKISSGMDEYGNSRTKLYMEQNGVEKYALVSDKIQYSKCRIHEYTASTVSFDQIGLTVGDVIQVGTDGSGYINQINVVYRANQQGTQAQNAWLTYPEYDMQFQSEPEGAAVGLVNAVDVDNRILQIAMGTEEDALTYDTLASVATIVIYDSATKKSKTGTLGELMQDDLVIVRTDVDYAARASQILVLR